MSSTATITAAEITEGTILLGASLRRIATGNRLVESVNYYDDGDVVVYTHDGGRTIYPAGATVTVLA